MEGCKGEFARHCAQRVFAAEVEGVLEGETALKEGVADETLRRGFGGEVHLEEKCAVNFGEEGVVEGR